MIRRFARQAARVDPEALSKQAEASLEATKAKQPHVNSLIAYLESRNGQNGFGEDFDITIRSPRRA